MAIIISKHNENALRIDESSFQDENKMQKYIFTNPESLPIDDIKDESKLLIVSREFPTNSGPIDALGFDKDGDIYIIETKLEKNSDKRKVVAQVLDYGAALYFHSNNYQDFIAIIDNEINKNFNTTFRNKTIDFFDFNEDEYNQFCQNIENNLTLGNYKFIVLMDKLEPRLKDIIKYVNQNSNFDLFGVEMEYYEFENYQIIIPKIFGTEVTKRNTVTTKKRFTKKWTDKDFFEELEKKRNKKDIEIVKIIYNFSNKNAKICKYGNGKTGTLLAVYEITENTTTYTIDTNGEFWIYAVSIIDEKKKKLIIDFCNKNKFRKTKKDYFFLQISELDKTRINNIIKDLKPLLS